MRTDYKAYYPNNQNVMSQTQMSKEMKENLKDYGEVSGKKSLKY